MERLANNIAEKMAQQLDFDNDRKEVVAYGTFAILQTVFSIALVVAFGALFHVMVEALIISFTTSILRKYSGGAHASSPASCTVVGTILCIGQALLISFAARLLLDLKIVLILGLLSFVWSYAMVYKLAPVDSPAKPIRNQGKRKRMKKGSIIILSAYLVIVVLNIITYLYTGEGRLIAFSLCIYGGVLWQVFTLTRSGHLILSKIDTFFNQIINTIRRGRV